MRRRILVMIGIVALLMLGLFVGSAAQSIAAARNAASPHLKSRLGGGGDEDTAGKNEFNNISTFYYDMRSYPKDTIPTGARIDAELKAAQSLRSAPSSTSWEALGPTTLTGTNDGLIKGVKNQTNSGRATAIAVADSCSTKSCAVYVGTAGGGVWRTLNGLSDTPTWTPLTDGQKSLAIGAITLVSNKKAISTSNPYTLYVGTGEPNNAFENQAGVGIYKIVDDGANPNVLLLPTNTPFIDRSIGRIVVDSADKTGKTLYVATALGSHGASQVYGGQSSPPNLPHRGVYMTVDGGTTWNQILDSEVTGAPSIAYGSVHALQIVGKGKSRALYAGIQGVGVKRSTDGGATWTTIYAQPSATAADDRYDFAIPAKSIKTMYLVVGGTVPPPTNEPSRKGYLVVSTNITAATPTFKQQHGVDGFCGGQCWYDIFVAVSPKSSKTVYVGGTAHYDEPDALYGLGKNVISLGREVVRSTNGGKTFTDMSGDPTLNNLHPDQHAFAFNPNNPNIWFEGDDGGVWRSGGKYVSGIKLCGTAVSNTNYAECKQNLKIIPNKIVSLNDGLATLQPQSVAASPIKANTYLTGTQDNGTEIYDTGTKWINGDFGDGGVVNFDPVNDKIRYHNYYNPYSVVSLNGGGTTIKSDGSIDYDWYWVSDPFFDSNGNLKENVAFYTPVLADQNVAHAGTVYQGLESLWRTLDHGDPRIGTTNEASFKTICNNSFGTAASACGDWLPMGGADSKLATNTATYGADRIGRGFVAAIAIAPADSNIVYVGTAGGRIFKTTNALATNAADVKWTRVDDGPAATPVTPNRFVSGIVVDKTNANIIYVSYSGYGANTPTTLGHVFKADTTLIANSSLQAVLAATWTNLSGNLADAPATALLQDPTNANIFYLGTDFGVYTTSDDGTTWMAMNSGLPTTAVFQLTYDTKGNAVLAATHGRGVWKYAPPAAR